MKDYILRLVQTYPGVVGDWELKFKEHEDDNAKKAGAQFLSIIGSGMYIKGAMLFRLEPTGTVKEYIHIFSFLVERQVCITDAHLVKKQDG